MECPLKCREDGQLLLDYCAGKLAAGLAEALGQHVAECGACREWTRGQRTVWEALDEWEAAPVAADFDQRLYRRIHERAPWWQTALAPIGSMGRFWAWRGLPAAAAAGVLLMAGITLQHLAVSPTLVAGDMAQVEAVQPDQVERTLDAMEMLSEFSQHVRTDVPESKL